MTEPVADADRNRPATPDLRGFRRWTYAWLTAPDRGAARWLIAGVFALTMAQVAIQIRFNLWNRDFFNALDKRDADAFTHQIMVFLGLAAVSMGCSVYQLYLKQLIQLSWREWLTRKLTAHWLRDGRQYQLEMGDFQADNPDQRIAEDVRVSTELAVEFTLGLLISVSTLIAFIGILWSLSGPLEVALGGTAFEIPGYMVWAALLYALIGSSLTYLVGRPLVGINVRRTMTEADLRFGLTRARESGESIALIRGEADERRGVEALFGRVREAMRALMRSQRNLMWLTSAYGTLAMIFPTVVASPAYFSGAISLGGLMQIGAAFGQVQASLNWFVDNFPRIAEWRSAVSRLVTFTDALEDLDEVHREGEAPTITVTEAPEGAEEKLAFEDLQIAFSDGTVVIDGASAEIGPGERVLIRGESGTGKSTLFRAIGGIWPWGAGEIVIPPRDAMAFLPQRPYLPLGALATVLCYPRQPAEFPAEAQAEVLERVGLGHLVERLAEEERWDRVLSLGEQQRLAFARLLLHKPRWVFLDEATAALDEANQDQMMELLLEALPDAAVISIGHRPGLDAFHSRTLHLVKTEDGTRFAKPQRGAPARSAARWRITRRERRNA
jgi:putative ATP-binding cassette transporter